MSLFIKPSAVNQSLRILSTLPKNQTALFYFLIFARTPKITKNAEADRRAFEAEFYRYFGAPIKGGGKGTYDPFAAAWRAEEYINSTVYGRLLAGGHGWTEGSEAYFERTPASGGWPATFSLTELGFDNLKMRSSPPCLKYEYRLPLTALAIYYYRFIDVSSFSPKNVSDLCSQYTKEVLSINKRLVELTVKGSDIFGELFQSSPLTEDEMIACYPPSPYSTEEKTREFLYKDDINLIKKKLLPGQQVADFVRDLLRKGIC